MSDVETTLAERGARYGDFTDHANIVESVLGVWMDTPGWSKLSADKRQTMRMIADKTARVLNGDPEYRDNWHDIQGYAKLAEDRCHPAHSGAPQ